MQIVAFIKKPFYLLYKLWVGLVFWFTLLLIYPLFRWLYWRGKMQAAFRWKKRWAHLSRILLLCPLRIEWKGDLPPSPFVVVSNHSSYIDTVFMYCVIPEYFLFLGKAELLKWPLFGLFFKKQDIPVFRFDPRRAVNALDLAAQAIQRGDSIALYPEGTIPWESPVMKDFKSGAFRLAKQEQVPIVPITWQSNWKIMGEPTKIWSRSGPRAIRVVVHETILPAQFNDQSIAEISKEVREVIASEIEQMRDST